MTDYEMSALAAYWHAAGSGFERKYKLPRLATRVPEMEGARLFAVHAAGGWDEVAFGWGYCGPGELAAHALDRAVRFQEACDFALTALRLQDEGRLVTVHEGEAN